MEKNMKNDIAELNIRIYPQIVLASNKTAVFVKKKTTTTSLY